LDEIVSVEELERSALAKATELAELPTQAYAMKLDVRRDYIDIIAASLS
jgi:hypothetical protein